MRYFTSETSIHSLFCYLPILGISSVGDSKYSHISPQVFVPFLMLSKNPGMYQIKTAEINTLNAHIQLCTPVSILLSGKDSDEHMPKCLDRPAWPNCLPKRVKTALSFFGVISNCENASVRNYKTIRYVPLASLSSVLSLVSAA